MRGSLGEPQWLARLQSSAASSEGGSCVMRGRSCAVHHLDRSQLPSPSVPLCRVHGVHQLSCRMGSDLILTAFAPGAALSSSRRFRFPCPQTHPPVSPLLPATPFHHPTRTSTFVITLVLRPTADTGERLEKATQPSASHAASHPPPLQRRFDCVPCPLRCDCGCRDVFLQLSVRLLARVGVRVGVGPLPRLHLLLLLLLPPLPAPLAVLARGVHRHRRAAGGGSLIVGTPHLLLLVCLIGPLLALFLLLLLLRCSSSPGPGGSARLFLSPRIRHLLFA